MAGAIQEPGHPGRRSPAGGAAIHRGESLAGRDGRRMPASIVGAVLVVTAGAGPTPSRHGAGLRIAGGQPHGHASATLVGVRAPNARRRRNWRPSAAAMQRACPTASVAGSIDLSRRLKLDLTIRPRGRPRKHPNGKNSSDPFSAQHGKVMPSPLVSATLVVQTKDLRLAAVILKWAKRQK